MNQIESLLASDGDLSAFNFEEFRMKLESSIHRIEARANLLRKAQWGGLGLFLASVLAYGFVQWNDRNSDIWLFSIGICGYVALFFTAILAIIYQYHYAPALTHAKESLTSAMIKDLHRKVTDLTRKIDSP
jgi:UDP-N-acetylmuramyl pentapeptide phosphotransferase/UDP-N-acetylglucosamine-1-phosphate transferase